MLLSGRLTIYLGCELAERSALIALQQQRYGGLDALWFERFPLPFRLVWTTSCQKKEEVLQNRLNTSHHTTNITGAYTVDFVKLFCKILNNSSTPIMFQTERRLQQRQARPRHMAQHYERLWTVLLRKHKSSLLFL